MTKFLVINRNWVAWFVLVHGLFSSNFTLFPWRSNTSSFVSDSRLLIFLILSFKSKIISWTYQRLVVAGLFVHGLLVSVHVYPVKDKWKNKNSSMDEEKGLGWLAPTVLLILLVFTVNKWKICTMFLSCFSVNLLMFYHKCCSLIGYATRHLW